MYGGKLFFNATSQADTYAKLLDTIQERVLIITEDLFEIKYVNKPALEFLDRQRAHTG